MGKKNKKWKAPVKEFESLYPSRYGSHASMVVSNAKPVDDALVICLDEKGAYITEKQRLDTGIADSKRWAGQRYREEVFKATEIIKLSEKKEGE